MVFSLTSTDKDFPSFTLVRYGTRSQELIGPCSSVSNMVKRIFQKSFLISLIANIFRNVIFCRISTQIKIISIILFTSDKVEQKIWFQTVASTKTIIKINSGSRSIKEYIAFKVCFTRYRLDKSICLKIFLYKEKFILIF